MLKVNDYVLVRTYSAGLFAGYFRSRMAKKIILVNCRRLWRWHTINNGISISEVAVYGINQEKSKICCLEEWKIIEDVEISPCTDIARKSIQDAKDYIFMHGAKQTTTAHSGSGTACADGDGNGGGEGHGDGCSGYCAAHGLGRGSACSAGVGDGSGDSFSSSDSD